MTRWWVGLLALGSAAAASAQAMPLPTFLERATALEKKGPLALFHRGEINALFTEMKGASDQLKAERLAAEKAGRPAAFCPPAGQKGVSFSSTELLRELRAIPAAQARSMTMTDAMRTVLARRYPCRP
jgi:hypothetical protein